jgi:hypothetical protein
VNLGDLVAAFEWVAAGEAAGIDCEAYLNRDTGFIHWIGEGVENEPPDDIADEIKYVAVPAKSDFDLGRSLALRFAGERLMLESK